MSEPKFVTVAHMGHDAPWLQIQKREDVAKRIAYIKTNKPKHERPLRLKLLQIVKEPLPPRLEKIRAACLEAYAEWQKADAELQQTDAEWRKAYAEWRKADAEWQRVINSPEGVTFHKEVCGCAWTPNEPDILLQLAAQEEKQDEQAER